MRRSAKWFEKDYRRNLVDMHIEDWYDIFLSQLEPRRYVELLKRANVSTAMIYANSHIGHCYWKTRTGHMHRGIKGRDITGELIELCHREGMNVVIYYSLIYNNWAYENHPEWRMKLVDGREARALTGRYGVCCPNSGYRDFALSQVEELCQNYEFEGIFFDMTFWPVVCYCQSCQEKFLRETGRQMPQMIDWGKPEWMEFQRKREEWLGEFARVMTAKVKSLKPEVSVEHQFSTCVADWVFGVTEAIAEASDYCGGDFYGGALQESFICKLYYNLTKNQPFEFMTSRCINLADHTTTKPKELLEAQAFSAIANGGAFLFIDAIDPIGTLNEAIYEMMGEIYKRIEEYERFIGGKLIQDVAIYFSFESKFAPDDSGRSVLSASRRQPHLDCALNAAKSLLNAHIPFGIITRKNLHQLKDYKAIILPDVLWLDEEEAKAIREYVASGGRLYASYRTSLFGQEGKREDFLLSDVLGVSYKGETKEGVTYISPAEDIPSIFSDITPQYPLILFSPQIVSLPMDEKEVIANIKLPYTDPSDASKIVSIHSNPPGVETQHPAIVWRKFGKGEVIWVAGPLEMVEQEAHRGLFIRLIRGLVKEGFTFETNAPKCVEITMFKQEGRYIINVLNFQSELPNIPVSDIKLRVKKNGEPLKRAVILPSEAPLPIEVKEEYLELSLPPINTFLMIAIS